MHRRVLHSGTTGNPKGVVTHHRGAIQRGVQRCHLEHAAFPDVPVDAADVPLQRWCFPWTVAMLAGTHVCLRKVEAGQFLKPCACMVWITTVPPHRAQPVDQRASRAARWSHAGGARRWRGRAPAAMIEGMARIGFDLTMRMDSRGLWSRGGRCQARSLGGDQPVGTGAAQWPPGRALRTAGGNDVLEPETMTEVPADAQTLVSHVSAATS